MSAIDSATPFPACPNCGRQHEAKNFKWRERWTGRGHEQVWDCDKVKCECGWLLGRKVPVFKPNAAGYVWRQVPECERCEDRKTIRVLGGGGDYEDWPCPDCRAEAHQRSQALIYGAADGEAE